MRSLLSAARNRISDLVNKNEWLLRNLANISWKFMEQGVRIFLNLASGIFVARYLGPENLGLLSYTQSYVLMFSVLANLGMDWLIVSELVTHQAQQVAIINTCFFLKLVGSVVAITAILLSFIFLQPDASGRIYIIIVACSLGFQSFNIIELYFQGSRLNKYSSLASMASTCIAHGIRIIMVYQQSSLMAFVWMMLMDFVLLAFFLLIYYYKQSGRLVLPTFDKQIALRLFKRGWPQFISAALLVFYARIDQIMIKEMLSLSDVGYYSIANRFIDIFSLASIIITGALFPILQNTRQHSEVLYKKRLLLVFKINFILFIIFFLVLLSSSNILIVGLYGEAYLPAVMLLILMSGKLFFTHMSGVINYFAIMENLTHIFMYSILFASIIYVFLNYMLIPEFGVAGAIISGYITQILFFYAPAFFNKRIRGVIILQMKAIVSFYRIKVE